MTDITYKILIVEDDDTIASAVLNQVKGWGYEAECVQDFSKVLDTFVAFEPALILLDITLPFHNGFFWCQEIRKISKVPIIFLSSASDNMNIIMAMNMGADDFIAKPFDFSVLIAKMQALLRRSYDFSSENNLIACKGAVLNLRDASLTYQGKKLELTKNDFKILETLLSNRGKTVSRDTLMTKLWETDCYVDENTLTVNVTRLRKKLEELGLTNFIITKKGLGYLVE
ncbi:MAG: response regulator transcription factor [Lachnospiraceae bacterium]|uniref:response regulator transcription factor n=1 Tax=Roseburia hominis TaxID=301301 RepID=UPI001F471F68|nr:response regulator transcription factor [Roseburia hominis]MCI5713849.1 response regulator transcription factor [Lachnospiraceae bacterium]MDD6168793.1 response regulator transcription factor [Lachnospiraceae bacterium]MDY4838981.1 response regulator transcription factor [Lachnospiraceae bacterium]